MTSLQNSRPTFNKHIYDLDLTAVLSNIITPYIEILVHYKCIYNTFDDYLAARVNLQRFCCLWGICSGNLTVSRLVRFANTPPTRDISVQNKETSHKSTK